MKIGLIGNTRISESLLKVLGMFHDGILKKEKVEEVLESEAIFLSLPLVQTLNKRIDSSLVMEYLRRFENNKYTGLIIITTSLPLGFFKTARKMNLRVLYSPFVFEPKKEIQELVDPQFIMISGSTEDYLEFMNIFYWINPQRVIKIGDRSAEIAKLAIESFRAMKISYLNELERICHLHGADISKVIDILRLERTKIPLPGTGSYEGDLLMNIDELRNSTPNTWLLHSVDKINDRTRKEMKLK